MFVSCIPLHAVLSLLLFLQQTVVFYLAKPLSEITVPLQYGISIEEKMTIATKTLRPLLQKFLADIGIGLRNH